MVHTWGPRGGHFGTKSEKKGPEYIPKFVCKKMKRIAKFCKNVAKMEVEIMDLSYLSSEANIARNYCIYNIFLGFVHVKNYENRWIC